MDEVYSLPKIVIEETIIKQKVEENKFKLDPFPQTFYISKKLIVCDEATDNQGQCYNLLYVRNLRTFVIS